VKKLQKNHVGETLMFLGSHEIFSEYASGLIYAKIFNFQPSYTQYNGNQYGNNRWAGLMPEHKLFHVNRPFLFFVTNTERDVLFAGVVRSIDTKHNQVLGQKKIYADKECSLAVKN
jgi:hypothetical protein